MAISKNNIKKWFKMLTGKSILHVNQNEGKIYSFKKLEGYYNDLTEKVLLDKEHFESTNVFLHETGEGKYFFPIAIFQYGLGCYDLFLLNNSSDLMLKKFKAHAKWAYENINENGSWENFFFNHPKYPYSAMAQGEGASLLLRAYNQFRDEKYLQAAKKAIDFMLLPVEQGGTAKYEGEQIYLYEFTCFPYVFNGWIFAIFGLIDYVLITNDTGYYKEVLKKTLVTFEKNIDKMDNGYWSMYRNDKRIASPFYHDLHIAQLSVLYKFTKKNCYKFYADKFKYYKTK